MAKGTVVIDPGHGGSLETGGSSANNATTPSGILEKNMTLRFGLLVRDAIKAAATAGGHTITVVMTRDTDKNLGLTARANVAKANDADLFLSIHHNASIAHNARGVETLVRPKNAGNVNHADDTSFAKKIQVLECGDGEKLARINRRCGIEIIQALHLRCKIRTCQNPAAAQSTNAINFGQAARDHELRPEVK